MNSSDLFEKYLESFAPLIEPIKDTTKLHHPIPIGISIPDLIKEMGATVQEVEPIFLSIYMIMSALDIGVSTINLVKSNNKLSDSLASYLEGITPSNKIFDAVFTFRTLKPEEMISEKEKEKILEEIRNISRI